MSKHGKWESNKNGGGGFITMSDGSLVFVAEALGKTKKLRVKCAAFIVRACNSHKDLLEACKEAFEKLSPKGGIQKDFSGHVAMSTLSKAITKAEKGVE